MQDMVASFQEALVAWAPMLVSAIVVLMVGW